MSAHVVTLKKLFCLCYVLVRLYERWPPNNLNRKVQTPRICHRLFTRENIRCEEARKFLQSWRFERTICSQFSEALTLYLSITNSQNTLPHYRDCKIDLYLKCSLQSPGVHIVPKNIHLFVVLNLPTNACNVVTLSWIAPSQSRNKNVEYF